jgi:HK97 gp10 family phage protein
VTRIVFEPDWERHLDAPEAELLEHLGGEIEADAKVACPVDTGRLRDSIGHEVDGDTVRVTASAPYAAYVEEGTRHMAAEPYLRPALYRERG